MNQLRLFLSTILLTTFTGAIMACSAFFCDADHKLFAKNFDWYSGDGYLIKNLRGQYKYAYNFRGTAVAQWTSKYGSITFNQIGKEFPYGGMNEAGLVVEQLWLTNSAYQDNGNSEISELEWIQYQLDNYETVAEVIVHINELTIKQIATVHYLIADNTGAAAAIEFVAGKVIITPKIADCQVLTNSNIADSKSYFSRNSNVDPCSRRTLDRYCILQEQLSSIPTKVSDSFEKLTAVSENREKYKSYWSIVYDIDERKIYYKSVDNTSVKTISLSDFNFADDASVEYNDVNTATVNFEKYTAAKNLKLLSSAMKMMKLTIDERMANAHQMNPSQKTSDLVFQKHYTDLIVEFNSKKSTGTIFFSLIKGEENYAKYIGFKMGTVRAAGKKTILHLPNMPRGEFALVCYQDTDFDNRMDKNLFGIPTNTGFSRNNKKLFGIPPKYELAKLSLDSEMTIEVEID